MPLNSPTHEPAARDAWGRLYVVATPIGHLDDITLRALNILSTVDLIAAEDTRHTGMLLKRHGIETRQVSYHEHNESARTPELIQRMRNGQSIALVTDAGTPLISDPGYRLVNAAVEQGIVVVPIPGPTAAIAALSVSGLPSDGFVFIGFLPKKLNMRRRMLQESAAERRTLVFYESPQRIAGLLHDVLAEMGNRPCVLAREMTKKYEEFMRGALTEVIRQVDSRPALKGECTLIVAGFDADQDKAPLEQIEADIIKALQENRIGLSELARDLAQKYRMPKSIIYQTALRLKAADPNSNRTETT